jgi:hypothetical protein
MVPNVDDYRVARLPNMWDPSTHVETVGRKVVLLIKRD